MKTLRDNQDRKGGRSRVRFRDMVGRLFGCLVVVADDEPGGSHGMRRVECVCSCGTVCRIHTTNLRNGSTRSCGRCGFRGGFRDGSGARFSDEDFRRANLVRELPPALSDRVVAALSGRIERHPDNSAREREYRSALLRAGMIHTMPGPQDFVGGRYSAKDYPPKYVTIDFLDMMPSLFDGTNYY